jgi:D-serine dehydratase
VTLQLSEVLDSPVGPTTKGFPGNAGPMPLDKVGSQGWNVLAEDLPLPVMVLKRSAVEHNLATMRSYCDRRGLLLAPHAKTTMAPQLMQAQLEAGAWGLTVASSQQAQVLRALGCRRIVVANQLVGAPNVRYLAEQLRDDPAFELYSWVDSPESVQALVEAAELAGLDRPWQVLLEVGWPGGRTGTRDAAAAAATVAAVTASRGRVELVGISVFEGLLAVSTIGSSAAGGVSTGVSLEELLADVVATADRLHATGVLPEGYLLTGGGSASFDAVAERFVGAAGDPRVLLRSGCYVTHDHGMNHTLSPLGTADHRAPEEDGTLEPALEVWAYVHSAPEPGLAFLTLGRRDAPYDAGLPVPLFRIAAGSTQRVPLTGEVTGLNDQHCYLRYDGELAVGDRVVLGISHPCTAFDKWQVIPVVDDDWNVVDAVRTYF